MLTFAEADDAANLGKPALRMDCRVKPGNDDIEERSRGAGAPEFCRYDAQGAEPDPVMRRRMVDSGCLQITFSL